MQQLLFPLTFEVSGFSKKLLEENLPLFEKLKIGIRSLGENFFMVDALPEGMDEEKILLFINQLGEEKEEKKIAFSLNHLIKTRALSFEEAKLIIGVLFSCKTPYICPEGKPIMIPWPREEIRRLFQ